MNAIWKKSSFKVRWLSSKPKNKTCVKKKKWLFFFKCVETSVHSLVQLGTPPPPQFLPKGIKVCWKISFEGNKNLLIKRLIILCCPQTIYESPLHCCNTTILPVSIWTDKTALQQIYYKYLFISSYLFLHIHT